MKKPSAKRDLTITNVWPQSRVIQYQINPNKPEVDNDLYSFGHITHSGMYSRSLSVNACYDFDEVIDFINGVYPKSNYVDRDANIVHTFIDNSVDGLMIGNKGQGTVIAGDGKITAQFRLGSTTWYGTENGRIYMYKDSFSELVGASLILDDVLTQKPITMIHFIDDGNRGVATDGHIYFETSDGGLTWDIIS